MSPKGKTPISPQEKPHGELEPAKPTTQEYWIQLEAHPWDVCPNNIDRLIGMTLENHPDYGKPPRYSPHQLGAPVLYRPFSKDEGREHFALIYRRYKPPTRDDGTDRWLVPDDRKVNPWDLNEPDPRVTQGTIPGPTIECMVGDRVLIHFRNWDYRFAEGDEKLAARSAHSMHPHGFLFSNLYDGAYPLSPPDPSQPVGQEATHWNKIGVTNFKKGDRVPFQGTFTYVWDTLGYPSTAGVWLYHDHSICDVHNVELGAIGFIVIHNPDDPNDVVRQNLPGSHNGPLTRYVCPTPSTSQGGPAPSVSQGGPRLLPHHLDQLVELPGEVDESGGPRLGLDFGGGALVGQADPEYKTMSSLCWRVYRKPPAKAQFLLLFHNLGDAHMCINGRKYLGNTPTLIAGTDTKMRFGVMGMGNIDGFHTFHIHGHRWIVPGPGGVTAAEIEASPQVAATSQFEDTRTFGPANTFSFTVVENSMMGALPPGLGEWHLHCHVLSHMMDGMMGSLLVVEEGSLASRLPEGVPCHTPVEEEKPGGEEEGHGGHGDGPASPKKTTVNMLATEFSPPTVSIKAGETVTWVSQTPVPHTTTSDTGVWNSPDMVQGDTYDHAFPDAGHYPYHCARHPMTGMIEVT